MVFLMVKAPSLFRMGTSMLVSGKMTRHMAKAPTHEPMDASTSENSRMA